MFHLCASHVWTREKQTVCHLFSAVMILLSFSAVFLFVLKRSWIWPLSENIQKLSSLFLFVRPEDRVKIRYGHKCNLWNFELLLCHKRNLCDDFQTEPELPWHTQRSWPCSEEGWAIRHYETISPSLLLRRLKLPHRRIGFKGVAVLFSRLHVHCFTLRFCKNYFPLLSLEAFAIIDFIVIVRACLCWDYDYCVTFGVSYQFVGKYKYFVNFGCMYRYKLYLRNLEYTWKFQALEGVIESYCIFTKAWQLIDVTVEIAWG